MALIKELGAKTHRFSLSWSRIIPLGGVDDPVNPLGVEVSRLNLALQPSLTFSHSQFYSNFIDELLANGIEPMVTLL